MRKELRGYQRLEVHEVQGKHGPKIFKHRVIMTSSYCKGENHNGKGCFLKKNGIRLEVPKPVSR